MMGKRLFDIFFSVLALAMVFVPGIFISIIITLGSKGGPFYRQVRVGRHGRTFKLYKFRTMHTGSDARGLLTVGNADSRITNIGRFLRRSKMDELPQFINILAGQMSFVGPRPEVPKYTALYNSNQQKVLSVRPGLTDYASIEYINENEILAKQDNPEQYYIDVVMPAKLELNLKYIREMSMATDLKIIFNTLFKIGR